MPKKQRKQKKEIKTKMSNAREEMLKLTVERLENKSKSVMLDINIILSNPESSGNTVGKLSELMIELAISENALTHAKNFYAQCKQTTEP